MGKYFKNELLMHHLTTIIVKSVIAGGLIYFMNKSSYQSMGFALICLMFLTLYSILSVFQFFFKLTQNYLIGGVLALACIIGMPFLMSSVEQNGLISLLAVIIIFLSAIIADILKLVSIIKIDVE